MSEMREYLASHTGPVLFLIVFAEQIGLPLPAAPLLIAAGALAVDGALSPSTMILLTIAASLVADGIWFYFGWRGGGRVLEMFRKLLRYDRSTFERAERLFALHGVWLVAGAKFLPWFGNLIPPLAGTFHMSIARFLRLDLLSSLLYGGFYIGLGFFFRTEVNTALDLLGQISFGKIGAVVAAALALWTWKHRSGPKTVAATQPSGILC
jgi:membrane protein DedA with SNARE-associated domain